MLIDTGAATNVIPLKIVKRKGYGIDTRVRKWVSGYDGQASQTLGQVTLEVMLGSTLKEIHFDVVEKAEEIIFGKKAIGEFDAKIDCKRDVLLLPDDQEIHCFHVRNEGENSRLH